MKALRLLCCIAILNFQFSIFNLSSAAKLYLCDGFDIDDYTINEGDAFMDANGYLPFADCYLSDIDSITFDEPNIACVSIVYNGTSASVSIDERISGISYSISGADVAITSTNTSEEILYRLSGNSSDGSLTINGSYKMTIQLEGISLTSLKGAAIDIECGKRIEMKMKKNTINSFVDCENGSQKAAVYVKGHLEIKGKGTINITGKTKHGLYAGEYLRFKPSTGFVNILGSVSDGIHCGKGSSAADDYEHCRFVMDGGEISIENAGTDCIDADDYGSVIINDGSLSLAVSQDSGNGISCDSIMRMNGGAIDIVMNGSDCSGIRFCYDSELVGGTISANVAGSGNKGIRARRFTSSSKCVLNGGNAHFGGTNVAMNVSGGTSSTKTISAGIYVDATLYQSAGTLNVATSNSAAKSIYAGTIQQTGGIQIAD